MQDKPVFTRVHSLDSASSRLRARFAVAVAAGSLIVTLLSSGAFGQTTSTWNSASTNSAWHRSANWIGELADRMPGVDSNTSSTIDGHVNDVAVFETINSSLTFIGINFGTSGQSGVGIQSSAANGLLSLGAIDFNGSKSIPLGKFDGSTGSALLRLNGSTLDAIENIILRHRASFDFTLAGTVNSVTGTHMSLALNNATENIVQLTGSGNLLITAAISSAASTVTFAGNGSGRVELTGSNAFLPTTGSTRLQLTGPEVRFAGDASFGAVPATVQPAYLVIDGGTLSTSLGSHVLIHANRGIQVGDAQGTSWSVPSSRVVTYNGVIVDKPGAAGVLRKQGGGNLSLGGASTYTGDTFIEQGSVVLTSGANRLPSTTAVHLGGSSGGTLGLLDLNGLALEIAGLNSVAGSNSTAANNIVSSASSATLTLGGSGTYAFGDGTDANSGVIDGAISLVKSGSGTQTLGDANTYTGTTTISGGTLLVNGSLSAHASPVNVEAAGSLGGYGAIGRPVTVAGKLAPGASIGVLSTGDLALSNGSTYVVELTGSGTTAGMHYDQTNVGGLVMLGSAASDRVTLSLSPAGYTHTPGNAFVLINNDSTDAVSYGGASGGLFKSGTTDLTNDAQFIDSGNAYRLTYTGGSNGNDIVLTALNKGSLSLAAGVPARAMVGQSATVGFTLSNSAGAYDTTVGYTLGGAASGSGTLAPGASVSSTASVVAASPGTNASAVDATADAFGNDAAGVNVHVTGVEKRVVTAAPVNFGSVIVNTPVSAGSTFSTSGSHDTRTDVTLATGSIAADANGIGLDAGGAGALFNDVDDVATRTLSGVFSTLGAKSGVIGVGLSTAENGGLGLPTEGAYPDVGVAYVATSLAHGNGGFDLADSGTKDLGSIGAVATGQTISGTFTLHNLASPLDVSGGDFTAPLQIEGISFASGSVGGALTLDPAGPIAGGGSAAITYHFLRTDPGAFATLYTLNVRDLAGILGGTANHGGALSLWISGDSLSAVPEPLTAAGVLLLAGRVLGRRGRASL